MVKKMYILAQGFAENGGSFFGFVEEIAKAFSGKRYAVKILCRKMQKAEKNCERFSYAEVYRFQFSKFPFFNAIAEELLFAFKVNSFLKKDNFQKYGLGVKIYSIYFQNSKSTSFSHFLLHG